MSAEFFATSIAGLRRVLRKRPAILWETPEGIYWSDNMHSGSRQHFREVCDGLWIPSFVVNKLRFFPSDALAVVDSEQSELTIEYASGRYRLALFMLDCSCPAIPRLVETWRHGDKMRRIKLEKEDETKFDTWVEQRGGRSYKWTGSRYKLDRVVVTHLGTVMLVEWKTETGALTEHQKEILKHAHSTGHVQSVVTVRSLEEAKVVYGNHCFEIGCGLGYKD